MVEDKKLVAAKSVFENLCAYLDKKQYHYSKEEDELMVFLAFNGDDLPIKIRFIVDVEAQLLQVISLLPFKVPEDKKTDMAIATCAVTNKVIVGSFDYIIGEGVVCFRLSSSFIESKIGDEFFSYFLDCTNCVVDEFNDKFLDLCNGKIDISCFLNDD